MTEVHGNVVDIAPEAFGDQLLEAAAAGTDLLTLADVLDFKVGGTVRVVGSTTDTVSKVTAVVQNEDRTGTLKLATPLTGDADDGARVDVWNPVTGEEVAEWIADVRDSLDGIVKPYPIAHSLIANLPDGVESVRDASVVVRRDEDGRSSVVEVIGKRSVIDGTYLDPDTVPLPDIPDFPETPDPPAVAPTPVVTPGPAAAIVQWDSTTIPIGCVVDLHVADTDAAPPSPTTLWSESVAKPVWVDQQADGTPIPAPPAAPLWFAIVVRNADDVASAPSPWVSGQAGQIDPAYLLMLVGTLIAEKLIGKTISGVEITGSKLNIADALIAEPGLAQLTGKAFLNELTVSGNAQIRGLDNLLQGLLTLGKGVSDPTGKPTVTSSWTSLDINQDAADDTQLRGLTDTPSGTPKWVTVLNDGGEDLEYRLVDKATGATSGAFLNPPTLRPTSITRIGTSYYVLGTVPSGLAGRKWVIAKYDSAWALQTQVDVPYSMPTDRRAAIGPAGGTDLIVGWVSNADNARYAIHRTSDLAVTEGPAGMKSTTYPTAPSTSMIGVYRGPGPAGWHNATRTVAVYEDTASEVFTPSTDAVPNAPVPSEVFTRPNGAALRGFWFDGTRYRALAADGKIYDYALHTGAAADYAYTWYDNDPGGLGQAESGISGRSAVTIPRGARPTINTPPPPDDGTVDGANTVRVYAGTTGGTLRRQAEYAEFERARSFDVLTTGSGSTPPNPSEFAGRTSTVPGRIQAGDFWFDGAGGASLGTSGVRNAVDARVAAAQPSSSRGTAGYASANPTHALSGSWATLAAFDAGTNTGATKVPAVDQGVWIIGSDGAGLYLITAAASFVGNSTGGRRGVKIQRALSTSVTTFEDIAEVSIPNLASNQDWSDAVAAQLQLAAGDRVRIQTFQNSGGTLAYNKERCRVALTRVAL